MLLLESPAASDGHLRISDYARADIVEILTYTENAFGADARWRYRQLIGVSLEILGKHPLIVGSVDRSELGDQIRSYHLRQCRFHPKLASAQVQNPRHFFLYRILPGEIVSIGRLLHERMEVQRHLPLDYGDI